MTTPSKKAMEAAKAARSHYAQYGRLEMGEFATIIDDHMKELVEVSTSLIESLSRCYRTDVCMDGSTPMIGGVSKTEFEKRVIPSIKAVEDALAKYKGTA